MAKRLNKAQEIRRFVQANPTKTAREIAARLTKKRGMEFTVAYAHTTLHKLNFKRLPWS